VRGENVYKDLQRPEQQSSSHILWPECCCKKKSPLTHFSVNGGFRVWSI